MNRIRKYSEPVMIRSYYLNNNDKKHGLYRSTSFQSYYINGNNVGSMKKFYCGKISYLQTMKKRKNGVTIYFKNL